MHGFNSVNNSIFDPFIDRCLLCFTWEVVFVFMKWACHDSVRQIKGFFDTVSMMDVNIYVQHSLVHFEQLKNS